MRVLVTGHRGHVGVHVAEFLRGQGCEVTGFDRADGDDLLDAVAVRRAMAGCAAVVHLGALAHDTAGSPEQIMATNVLGTWHVLLAAGQAGLERVVHCSSAQVFGTAEGERLPSYLPVDDEHPRLATRPYGLSKKLGEDLCEGFTRRTGIPAIALRPVLVTVPGQAEQIAAGWRAEPRREYEPFWEFGGFVDVRDVATAVHRALTVPLAGHHRVLLAADGIAATAPALTMAARLAPTVPVRHPERWADDPWRALIDASAARRLLGWRPEHDWPRPGRGDTRT